AVDGDNFLRACAVLLLWGRGYVEPVVPPPSPRHIAAQQLLALALQEGRFGLSTWRQWWGGLPVMDDAEEVLEYLRSEQFLVEDQGMAFIGPRAEQEFGRCHFMDLLATFTADLELRVVAGRREVGTVSPLSVQGRAGEEPRRLLLAGHAWRVEHVDWQRREVVVSEQPEKGSVRWPSEAMAESFALVRAQREVLLGTTPEVTMSRRAVAALERVRSELAPTVDASGMVLADAKDRRELWTWAGLRDNETLAAALGSDSVRGADNRRVVLEPHVTVDELRAAPVSTALPAIDAAALDGLKFAVALPVDLARSTLAERFVGRALSPRDSITVRSTTPSPRQS